MCKSESTQKHLFYTGESFCTFRDPGLGVWLLLRTNFYVGGKNFAVEDKMGGKDGKIPSDNPSLHTLERKCFR